MAAGGLGAGGERLPNGHEVSFWGDRKILGLEQQGWRNIVSVLNAADWITLT